MARRANVKALVAVQPLLYSYFVDALGMPGFIQRSGAKVSEKRLGFDIARAPMQLRGKPGSINICNGE